MKILLIDDEPILLSCLHSLLEAKFKDYKFLLAKNVEEAVALYVENVDDIKLCVVDYIMPKINGDEFIKIARELDQNKNIVMLTASADDSGIRGKLDSSNIKGQQIPIMKKPMSRTFLTQINYFLES